MVMTTAQLLIIEWRTIACFTALTIATIAVIIWVIEGGMDK
tara:strand:+ start:734 stop:856 length:123 start_codon:yes stop_codon:yes gene_type:complete